MMIVSSLIHHFNLVLIILVELSSLHIFITFISIQQVLDRDFSDQRLQLGRLIYLVHCLIVHLLMIHLIFMNIHLICDTFLYVCVCMVCVTVLYYKCIVLSCIVYIAMLCIASYVVFVTLYDLCVYIVSPFGKEEWLSEANCQNLILIN